ANSAAEDAPICGGNMRILIDPTASESSGQYFAVASALQERRRGVLTRNLVEGLAPIINFFTEDPCDSPDNAYARALATGEVQVFSTSEGIAEPIIPGPMLLISGGGHVGQALARAAQLVGFEVVVIEDRQEFANPELFPPGINCRRSSFKEAL